MYFCIKRFFVFAIKPLLNLKTKNNSMKKSNFSLGSSPWRRTLLQSIPIAVGLLTAIHCDAEVAIASSPSSSEITWQSSVIKGSVVDMNGEPLIGVNVLEKGTTNGTITDFDGNFSLKLSSSKSTLVVSYIGYVTQELSTSGKTQFKIVLKDDSKALEEVVVVGYGTQKKVNVIGSITSVDSKKLESRSTPSVSNLLTGQMPGVTITQSSGRPGNDGGTIRVRGVGSFGASPDPLVLIDGLPGSINDISPSDIETISVLKDASSAAIYGSRAANGVILIKTKEGRSGKVSVTYNGYIGFNKATALPDFCDTWEYAEEYNKAIGSDNFTAEEIQKFKDGSDPYNYPNEKYLEDILGNKGLQTGHELSLNGGNETTKYMLSLGYLKQDGIMKNNDFNRYNARLNLVTNITKNLTLTTRVDGMISKRTEPSTPGAMNGEGPLIIIRDAVRYPGLWPTVLEDGSYGLGPKVLGTPTSWLDSGAFYTDSYKKFNSNIELQYKPIKDLTLKVIGGYNYTGRQERHYRSAMVITGDRTLGPSSLTDKMYQTEYKTFQAIADYNTSIGKHNIGILAGYTWEDESQRYVSGYRKEFPTDETPYLDAGGADSQTNNGNGYDWAIMSAIGRITYNYAERYLFETTMRYDGSSRFPKDSKFGFFPSVAVGWRISEENFFKNAEKLEFINNLKLKASYGSLGNNNIGNYSYQSVYALDSKMNYVFGGYTNGAAVTTYADPNLKWEKTRTADVGLELGMFNNKLTIGASYFYRKTSDILYKPSASFSSIFGLSIQEINTGTLKNTGFELELGHQNNISDFHYNINANFSVIKNEVVTLGAGNVEQLSGMVGNGSDLFIGYPMQMYYGYKSDGVFLTDAEVGEWYDQSSIAPNSKAGDIRYVDVDGDGKVTEADKQYLGSRIPKYTFGLSLGAQYKNFDLSILLQGVAGVKGMLNGTAGWAFSAEGNIQRWQKEESWTNNQQERYPGYPRLEVLSNAGSNNTLVSDFWVLNASYLKVRNVQVGYNLPRKACKSIGLDNVRFYISLDNPLSFHGYQKGWDPEISTDGSYYPILSTYTFGLNIKF